MSDKEIPIIKIHKLWAQIGPAINDENWDRAAEVATEIKKLIPLAINKKTCRTSSPHLDGVYRVGTMQYEQAPKHVKKAIDRMNGLLKVAKGRLK